MNESLGDRAFFPKITNIFCNYISFYKSPFSESVRLYRKSSQVGQENGDYLFGLWASFFLIWSRVLSGDDLDDIYSEAVSLRGFVNKTGDKKIIYAFDMVVTIVESLSGRASEGRMISVSDFDDYADFWEKTGFLPGKCWLSLFLGMYYLIMGEYDKTFDLLSNRAASMNPDVVMFPYSQYDFLYSLSRLRVKKGRTRNIRGR